MKLEVLPQLFSICKVADYGGVGISTFETDYTLT